MRSDKTRRAFFLTAIYGLWGLITAALGIPAAIYLLVPPKTRKSGEWAEAGDAVNLEPGVPEELTYRRNRVDGWKVTSEKTTAWVVKTSADSLVAFDPQCTHLGCAYHWNESLHYFLCPCHTSTFALDGKVLSGPAPRPLDRLQVKVDNGKILIGPVEKSGGAA